LTPAAQETNDHATEMNAIHCFYFLKVHHEVLYGSTFSLL
jgi:hypothetical protein